MKLLMLGCSHHNTPVELREQLAFSVAQQQEAVEQLQAQFPGAEFVVVSTCNRVELYAAADDGEDCPDCAQLSAFLAEFHQLEVAAVTDTLQENVGADAARHLFIVASSLDSMVVGEAQVLSQVKQAYELARGAGSVGAITNAAFQAAMRVAKRVANETAINQRRVSIPSVAVADFASQIFERFDDKQVLVIGAGEMGEETLRYLIDEGACQIAVVNRNAARAEELAQRVGGVAHPWDQLPSLLAEADLVIGTTGSTEPIVTLDAYRQYRHKRHQRPLFMLDLAVPRDFDPAIGGEPGVCLYSIDDLQRTCEQNRKAREKEWPKASRIIDAETVRFMAELNHRETGPTIQRLQARAEALRNDELARLFNKLGDLDERSQSEIARSFDRLIGKLLHPPLESLRDEAESGSPHGLLDALRKLFQINE